MAKTILLVEGTDDKHVIKQLCGNRGFPEINKIERQLQNWA
jgi:hypothetical protein